MSVTAPPNVHNGTFTVSHQERGHFTLKLHTAKTGALAGKRILSLLVGPDNVNNYKGVAFWNDEKQTVHVWRRHRGPDSRLPINGFTWQQKGWSTVETKLAVWADLVIRGEGRGGDGRKGYWGGEGYAVALAGHCVICNRKLTDPESIRLGIGPVCGNRS
jgi:hypothetical protein